MFLIGQLWPYIRQSETCFSQNMSSCTFFPKVYNLVFSTFSVLETGNSSQKGNSSKTGNSYDVNPVTEGFLVRTFPSKQTDKLDGSPDWTRNSS